MATLLIFLATFTLLVFVHEWGHFLAAKRQGIAVQEFGFGFPPRLFSFFWRGTTYSINLIPLGGFVRIKGEEGQQAEERDSFASRGAGQRSLVIIAGVFMNIVLGWALFTIGFASGFPQVLDGTIPEERIRDRTLFVVNVLKDAPAERVLEAGDEILFLGNTPFREVLKLQEYLAEKDGTPVSVTIQRKNERLERTVTPRFVDEAKKVALGVGLQEVGVVSYPLHLALIRGVTVTGVVLREIVFALGGVLRDLVVTQKVTVDLAGPVGIAVLTGQVAERGFVHLLQFAALLSLNLAVLNILPIPALDGGRLFFLLVEKIRRKPISQKTEGIIHRIGFALLLLLVIIVTYKDIAKFFF